MSPLAAFSRPIARGISYGTRRGSLAANGLSASGILALKPSAWFRYGLGIAVATGVSQWTDQSGNSNHLLQATAGAQPAKQADNSILFDGIAQTLKCSPFTLNQPESIYLLVKIVSWTSGSYLFDGNTIGSGRAVMSGVTPQFQFNAGSSLAADGNLQVGAYGVLSCVANGASSACQVSRTTPVTGNAGANNMGGFTIGCSGSGTLFGNIQVKEAIVFPTAHDGATRDRVTRYLGRVGNIAV